MRNILAFTFVLLLTSACNYQTSLCKNSVDGAAYVGNYSYDKKEIDQTVEESFDIFVQSGSYFLEMRSDDSEGPLPITFCKINSDLYIEVKAKDELFQLMQFKMKSMNEFTAKLVTFSESVLKANDIAFTKIFGLARSIENEEEDYEAMAKAIVIDDEDGQTLIKE